MANETVTAGGIDVNAAQECVDKARSIVEMIGPYAVNTFGRDAAQAISGSVWAVMDQLDKLALMVGLDPSETQA